MIIKNIILLAITNIATHNQYRCTFTISFILIIDHSSSNTTSTTTTMFFHTILLYTGLWQGRGDGKRCRALARYIYIYIYIVTKITPVYYNSSQITPVYHLPSHLFLSLIILLTVQLLYVNF